MPWTERDDFKDREDMDENEAGGDEETESAKYQLFDKTVSFFEDWPYFYDMSNEQFSNNAQVGLEIPLALPHEVLHQGVIVSQGGTAQ